MTHPIVIKVKNKKDLILRAGRVEVNEPHEQIELSLTFNDTYKIPKELDASISVDIYFQLDGQSHVAKRCLRVFTATLEELAAYRIDYFVETITPDDTYAFLPKNASKEDLAKQILLEKIIVQ